MRRTPEILAKTTANLEMLSTTLDNEVTKHFDKHTVEVNAKQTRTKLFRSDLQVTVVYITVGEKWRRDLSPADESSKEYGIVHPFLCNEIKRENIEKQEKEQSRHISEEIRGPVKCL